MPDAAPAAAVRRLLPADAEAFRALRLLALRTEPTAFGSSFEEEAGHPPELFRTRLAPDAPGAAFGAFRGAELVGMAGFHAAGAAKERHKGLLWGVFVQPAWRNGGTAEALVRAVIAHAAGRVLLLHASASVSAGAARRLYRRLGFAAYGIEADALCIDGAFHDEELLVLDLRAGRGASRPGKC